MGDDNQQNEEVGMVESDTETVELNIEEILYLEIDTRIPEWNFNQVNDLEIHAALDEAFEEDYSKSVEDLSWTKKSLRGLFRIDSDFYDRYIGKSIKVRGKDLFFTPKFKRAQETGDVNFEPSRKKNGTLITIFKAYRSEYKQIDHELFDNYFTDMNVEVIKQTCPQFKRGTTNLNNNRYLVVQKLDEEIEMKNKIGDSMILNGEKFKLQYNGMEKYCYLCRSKHGRECPRRVRFEYLKKLREGKTEKRKIYSDSVMRHANSLALTTDVSCMSGGGIAHLANAIVHDKKHEEVLICAGTNEIVYSKTSNEFVYTIEKSLQKLKKLAEDTKVTLVLPTVPTNTAHIKAKNIYLEEEANKIEEIQVIKIEEVDYDGIHPTEKGTIQILKQINDRCNKEIILEEVDETDLTTLRYNKVQPIYKVGCRGCDETGFIPYLCEACKELLPQVETDRFNEILQEVEAEMYPNLECNDYHMKDANSTNKRLSSEDGGGIPNKKPNCM